MTPNYTNDNVTTNTQNTFNTAHMNTDTFCAVLFVSQVCVVIDSHCTAWLKCCACHLIHACDERFSSTLSPPFSSSSSSSHSSLISCTSSFTSGYRDDSYSLTHTLQERDQFIEPLQSCAQVCSYASSNENSGCTSSSGARIGKTRKIQAWQLTKVRNKKR